MALPNLKKDKTFLKLVKDGLLIVSKSGKVVNAKTGNELGHVAKDASKYTMISYRDPNTKQAISIGKHRLVWLVFKGLIAKGLEVNHKDGVKSNNRLSNLELLSKSGNALHAYRVLGKRPTTAKLTPEQVRLIRVKSKSCTMRTLATKFDVSCHAIRQIVNNKSYLWVH